MAVLLWYYLTAISTAIIYCNHLNLLSVASNPAFSLKQIVYGTFCTSGSAMLLGKLVHLIDACG